KQNFVRCCPRWLAPSLVPEASILLPFSYLSSALLPSVVRYARLLYGGWLAPDYDLDLGAIGLDPVAHVLYWSVSESRQWSDRHQRFLLRRGAQRVGGLVCLFLLSGLCTCWFPLCLAEVASVAYQSLTWMLALSFSLSGMGNCSVSVKLECWEASELSIRFSDTTAAKISMSLWWSIGSRFSCGPLPLDRSIPVLLFRSLDHDMVALCRVGLLVHGSDHEFECLKISLGSCHEASSHRREPYLEVSSGV
ncbi:hypothetical protein IGI04_005981, partial [Brassica rapa subsp. trilocularis]